jgi:hypothetical protein
MILTDKIIKIIWENIYPINQYKENAQEEKPGSKNPCKSAISKFTYSFAQKHAFTKENVIPWHIKY